MYDVIIVVKYLIPKKLKNIKLVHIVLLIVGLNQEILNKANKFWF